MTQSDQPDFESAAALLPPYALALGMSVVGFNNRMPVLGIDFAESVEGRVGFVHGGAIGGLLEMSALVALRLALANNSVRLKPVNITVEYLRGAGQQRTFALARITRLGRRIANVSAEAWQDDGARPIATAWINIRLSQSEA